MYANFVRPPTIRNFRLPKPNPIIPSEHDATQNPSRPLYHNGRVLFQLSVYTPFNTVDFRCRNRLAASRSDRSPLPRVIIHRDSIHRPRLYVSKNLIFKFSTLEVVFISLAPLLVVNFRSDDRGSAATGVARRSYLHSCKMHPRTGRGNAIHGALCI